MFIWLDGNSKYLIVFFLVGFGGGGLDFIGFIIGIMV